MKKTLASSVLLLALSSGLVFASTATSSSAEKDYGQRASSTEKVHEAKAKSAAEKMAKKFDKERMRIANRFEEAVRNLKRLADRVETLIGKFESKGRDMSSQKALLAVARTKIAVAETDLLTLENTLASTSATTTRRALLKETRAESEKTKADIKAAHRALVDTINSLKPGKHEEATSTEKTENNSTSSASTSSRQ